MALARLAVVGVIFLLFAPAVGAQFSQVAKLRASDGGTKDFFGASVAADGNTVVIGAQGYAPQYGNAAYVFEPSDADPAHWGEVKKLVPHTPADFFGGSVAINGDIIIVGAWQPGHQFEGENAYIFYRDAGGADNWGVVRELDRDDDDFGNAVAVSGDTVVVGAQKARVSSTTFAGAAYIFQRNLGGADNWGEVIKLVAPVPGEYAYFGCAVAINGDTAIVGECYPDSRYPGAGSAYVFQRDAGGTNNWGLVTQLVPTDGHDGDFFGNSVAISGDTAVIGAPNNENAETYSGAGYVFERDLGGVDNWGQVAKVVPPDGEYQDEFGTSVAVYGDTLVVGSPSDDDPDGWEGRWDVGSAYVFARDEGGTDNWGQVTKVFGIGGMHEDLFGESVAISGGLVVGGSRGDDDLEYESGSVHVFRPSKNAAVAYLTGDLSRSSNRSIRPLCFLTARCW